MAREETYEMQHPAGFAVTVKGATRRDEFLRRGYTMADGSVPLTETEEEEESTDFNADDLDSYTVPQLQQLLAERDLPTTGNKAELIARLQEANQ